MVKFYPFCENGEVKYTVFVMPRLNESRNLVEGTPRKCKRVIIHGDEFTQEGDR